MKTLKKFALFAILVSIITSFSSCHTMQSGWHGAGAARPRGHK